MGQNDWCAHVTITFLPQHPIPPMAPFKTVAIHGNATKMLRHQQLKLSAQIAEEVEAAESATLAVEASSRAAAVELGPECVEAGTSDEVASLASRATALASRLVRCVCAGGWS